MNYKRDSRINWHGLGCLVVAVTCILIVSAFAGYIIHFIINH